LTHCLVHRCPDASGISHVERNRDGSTTSVGDERGSFGDLLLRSREDSYRHSLSRKSQRN
jgi:hypothetical protein